jgi:hypothetical protein
VKIEINGFLYWKKSHRNNRYYWVCEKRDMEPCNSSAVTLYVDGHHYLALKENGEKCVTNHNHLPVPNRLAISELCKEMKQSANTTNESPENIIRTATRNADAITIDGLPNRKSLKTLIQRQRGVDYTEPSHWKDLMIPDEMKCTLDGRPFIYDVSLPQLRIVLFVTQNSLIKLSEAEVWMFDGTFKTVPSIFGQLFTIHAKVGGINGRVCPLVYALMSDRTERSYKQVFEELNVLAARQQIHLRPVFVISDFEQASINAVTDIYPSVRHKSCHFHFSQIIWRRVVKLKLARRYKRHPNHALTVRHLSAVAYLDENDMNGVLRNIAQLFGTYRKSRELVNWFAKTFVRGEPPFPPKYPPEMWSVSDNNSFNFPRTQNSIESWHRKWISVVGATHIGVYKMISHIKDEEKQTETVFRSIERGDKAPVNRERKKREDNIQNIINDYAASNISRIKFLRSIARNLSY